MYVLACLASDDYVHGVAGGIYRPNSAIPASIAERDWFVIGKSALFFTSIVSGFTRGKLPTRSLLGIDLLS